MKYLLTILTLLLTNCGPVTQNTTPDPNPKVIGSPTISFDTTAAGVGDTTRVSYPVGGDTTEAQPFPFKKKK